MMTKKILKYVLILAVGGAVSLIGFRFISGERQQVELVIQRVRRADINNTVSATGRLEASVTVEVGTQVSGRIDKLYADFNSYVKKDQLIAQIDTEALESTLESVKAVLNQAEAEYEYQAARYKRYQQLMDKGMIAQQEFDEVVYAYKSANANLKSSKATFAKNKTNLEYAYIYSPIDGIVLERNVEEGETVAASFETPTLFTIANDLTQMEIETDVDEADIGLVKVGQHVEFTVDAFPYRTFSGEVIEIRLMPEESSNVITYTVIIDAPNPQKVLMPGMTANVVFYVTEKKNVLVVPNKAFEFTPVPELLDLYSETHPGVSFRNDDLKAAKNTIDSGKVLWVMENDEIHPQLVKVGETDEINYEVVSGINEGTAVILSLEGKKQNTGEAENSEPRSPFMPTPPGRTDKKNNDK